MATKYDLEEWILEALVELKGSGSIIEISKYVWGKYENELKKSGDLFYEWQYQIRWAATSLRKREQLKPVELSPSGIWELTKQA